MALAAVGVAQHGAVAHLHDIGPLLALTARFVAVLAGSLFAWAVILGSLVPGSLVPGSLVSGPLVARPVIPGAVILGTVIASARAGIAFPPAVAPAVVVARTIITGPIITGPIITGSIITGPIITRPVVARAIITRPIITRPIITGPVVPRPVIARPLVTRLPLTARPLNTLRTKLSGFSVAGVGLALRLAALVFEVDVVARRKLVATQNLAGRPAGLNRPKQAEIVLGVLQIVLAEHSVAGRIRVARELLILLEDVLRIAAHLDPLGAVRIESAVGVLLWLAAAASAAASAAIAPTLALHTFEISHILETVRLFPERLDRRFALSRFGHKVLYLEHFLRRTGVHFGGKCSRPGRSC